VRVIQEGLAMSVSVEGIVKNGVVVPNAPLPEGAVVEVHVVRGPLEAPHVSAAPLSLVNTLQMRFVLVRPGKFLMGSPDHEGQRGTDESPWHEVEITRPFYLGVCTVTQEEYPRVMGANPSHFASTGGGSRKVGGMDTPRFPVERVTWDEAVEFCLRLSGLPGEKSRGHAYRLPTEAEWEYACQGGHLFKASVPFHFDQTSLSMSSRQANFNGYFPYGRIATGPNLLRTTTVGAYPPNALGLYDMHGNVWEWCADWYEAGYYHVSPKRDPTGPYCSSENRRVLRGGSWNSLGHGLRAACRNRYEPGARNNNFGFRVVLDIL
jgi:formylglycine-generating enzyme required for sulfatase activity